MSLHIYNTLTRELERFKPLKQDEVKVYYCGPTPYNYAHIGNLRAYVFADTLKRVLNYNGYDVNHTINLTDFGHLTDDADAGDDKMMKGLRRENMDISLTSMRFLSDKFISFFKEDVWPHYLLIALAVGIFLHKPDQLTMDKKLIK